VETAWRELKEETSLTSSTVTLWRKGRPFSFQDQAVGREWTIYPFAFLLRPNGLAEPGRENDCDHENDGIVLDWEHDFYNWHDPEEVLSRLDKDGYNATVCGQMLVPRIADSLMGVYPEYNLGSTAGRRLREGLQQLQNDHKSGARELAAIALNILKEILLEVRPSKIKASEDQEKWEIWWKYVRLIAWHLWTNGRESMGAAIASALLSVLADLERLYQDRAREEEINRLIESLIEKRTAMTKRLCESFALYVRENVFVEKGSQQKTVKVVTLSASSTIRESILHFLNQTAKKTDLETIELHVLESRPLFEGVTLASSLLSSIQGDDESIENEKPSINVTIYPDNSAAIASRNADIFLIGADRIATDGAVSNKTGSLPAILAAKHVSPPIKVLVVSELDKVAGAEETHAEDEDNDPTEVVRGWRLAGVKGADVMDGKGRSAVRNVYFEWVPPGLVDTYITDDGVKGVADISERSAWVSRQIHRYFDNM
jgi:translation initiation factor 2B subunit (eIF-2B alpha/beta/delta family)